MPSYGAWLQGPDYDQSRRYLKHDTYDNRYLGDDGGDVHTDYLPSPDPRQVTEANLERAFVSAQSGHASEVDTRDIDHAADINYSQRQVTFVPQTYQSNWGAVSMRAKWHIAPEPDGYFYSPVSEGYFDPDAVGLQFEGQAPGPTYASGMSTIVGVTLGTLTKIITRVGDNTASSGLGEIEDIASIWQTSLMINPDGSPAAIELRVILGFTETTGPNAYETTLGADIDLTEILQPSGWSGAIWTDTAQFVAPRRMPANATDSGGGSVTYGWLMREPYVTYQVRPPRWRWVYDTTTPPHRRIFPRDDALGSGSTRNYPPPKARASSSRIGGGYL